MKRKKLTEADVTAESVFMLKRRQVLKMLGISATALSLPAAAQADLLDWFKGHDRPPAARAMWPSKPSMLRSKCPARKTGLSAGGSLTLTWRGYGWMKRCTR